MEPYWPGLFAKLLQGRDINDLLTSGGGGGGGAAAGGAGGAAAAVEEEVVEEEEEVEEVSMGSGNLFGDDEDEGDY